MSDFNPLEVEVASLRAVRARQATELAQLRHVLRHVAEGIAAARQSLRKFHDRIPELLRLEVTSQDLDTYFAAVDAHHAEIARTCTSETCACAEIDIGQALAKARDAQKKAEQLAVERGFLDATEPQRPHGKVINLGSRLKPARVYEQSSGQPLHAVEQCERRTDEEFAAAHDLPEGPGAA